MRAGDRYEPRSSAHRAVRRDVAFAILHQKARLIGSEGYIQQRDGWTFLCEHGLIVQVTVYPEPDIDKARAAAERLVESRE